MWKALGSIPNLGRLEAVLENSYIIMCHLSKGSSNIPEIIFLLKLKIHDPLTGISLTAHRMC